MKEQAPGIYDVELHSSQKSISEIHIYIIKGKPGQRSLMVDAGFRSRSCLKKMEDTLQELDIRMEDLDLFLTHKHHDHCGLASVYAEKGARLLMNPQEDRHGYDCLYYSHSYDNTSDQAKVLKSVGVTAERTPQVWEMFMDIKRRAQDKKGWEFEIPEFSYTPVSAGQKFTYGDYCLETIALPGHTMGQLGLYDQEHRILFSADQVLNGIVPIVGTSFPDEGLLKLYFKSLEYIKYHFQDWLILPAHNGPLQDLGGTVNRIVFSYLDKAYMIKSILDHSRRPMTVREIACLAYGMNPIPEDEAQFIKSKMVTTKTFSCLEYLYGEDFALREDKDGMLWWESPS